MGRSKKRKIGVGMAWCSKGQHQVVLEGFYRRRDGSARAWCIECSKQYAKDRESVQGLLNMQEVVSKLKEVMELDPEELLIQDQKQNKWKAPDYWELTLDWLTPIYAFDPRIDSTQGAELDRLTPQGEGVKSS